VPFHCVGQLQPQVRRLLRRNYLFVPYVRPPKVNAVALQGFRAIVAFLVLQAWEMKRLAKAANVHDTDEFSCNDFDMQPPKAEEWTLETAGKICEDIEASCGSVISGLSRLGV
jgi:hypothetical protein